MSQAYKWRRGSWYLRETDDCFLHGFQIRSRAEDDDHTDEISEPSPIVEIDLGFNDDVDAYKTAEAHLIAAAPELYEACEASLALGRKIYHNANAHEAPKDWAQVYTMLVSAMAKAQGEQS